LPQGGDHSDIAGKETGTDLDDSEEHIGDADRRNNDADRLAEQQFLAAQRGGRQGFEGALLAFADNGVGGNHSGEQCGRNQQDQERGADRLVNRSRPNRRADAKDGDQRFDQEDEREQRHGPDDEGAAAVLTELFA
jgi:hypothetical protein